jgi:hypothetical protein
MHPFTVNDPYHHPAQGLQVSDVKPFHVRLTQKLHQRIIESGGRFHGEVRVCVVTAQLKPKPASCLDSAPSPPSFVSQAGRITFVSNVVANSLMAMKPPEATVMR